MVGGLHHAVTVQSRRESTRPRFRDRRNTWPPGEHTAEGAAALEIARHVLPLIDGWGASHRYVQGAVKALEEWGGLARAFAAAAGNVRSYGARYRETAAIS